MKRCKHPIKYATSGACEEGFYILSWCPKCLEAWCAEGFGTKVRRKRAKGKGKA